MDEISPEIEMVTATIPKLSALEMLVMMFSTSHNLTVFHNTPTYASDKNTFEIMMRTNAVMMDYLCSKFNIDPDDVVKHFKLEMENGSLVTTESLEPEVPETMFRSQPGCEFG